MSIALHTPIGWLKISGEDGFVTEIKYIADGTGCDNISSPVIEQARKQLCQYFDGTRTQFDLPLKITASEFGQKVITQLMQVPYGTTVTYGQLAEMCGHPGAARAVGSAVRKNPFVVVVPCHRVVPSTGGIGNYSAGGSANKDWLLTFEMQNCPCNSLFGNPILSAMFGF